MPRRTLPPASTSTVANVVTPSTFSVRAEPITSVRVNGEDKYIVKLRHEADGYTYKLGPYDTREEAAKIDPAAFERANYMKAIVSYTGNTS